MQSAQQAFAQLLVREREAVRRADLDTLLSLQEDKRVLLGELRDAGASDEEVAELRSRAQANLVLLKHLVACLRGCLGIVEGPTYSPRGQMQRVGELGLRGVL